MASTLACIGLAVDDLDELGELLATLPAEPAGRVDGVETVRYVDPSGVRVLISRRDGEVVDLVPSFAAAPGALVAGLVARSGLAAGDVVDATGEISTRLLVDLEQVRHLDAEPDTDPHAEPVSVPVSVIALGVEMSVHADADAFTSSGASAMGAEADSPRWAAESFVSYGLFRTEDAEPTAFLAGTVVAVETREHSTSGQSFHAARVRTAGFEATVCLAAAEHPASPRPGNVVAGSCYLVADAPSLSSAEPSPPKRKWWRPVD